MNEFEYSFLVKNVEFNAVGNFLLGEKVKYAYSHDDPNFSEAGSPTEINDLEVFIGSQEVSEILNDETFDKIYEILVEKIEDEYLK